MVGFLIALLSGALMSIQGVFNTEVTKQCFCIVPVHLDVDRKRQCVSTLEGGTTLYAAGRCDRSRDHMDSDKKHGAAWACEGSTSDRDLTVDRSVSDRTSWTLWCGK